MNMEYLSIYLDFLWFFKLEFCSFPYWFKEVFEPKKVTTIDNMITASIGAYEYSKNILIKLYLKFCPTFKKCNILL